MVKPNERPHTFVNGTTQRDIRVAQSGQSEAPEGSNQPTRIAVWRPLPDKTVVQPEAPLSEAQQSVLEQLKAYTESNLVLKPGDREYDEYAKWEKRFLDMPDTYPRYVRASLNDLVEAKRRLQATLVWRREYRPDLIRPSEIAGEAQEGKVVVNGFDIAGRPVVWLRPSRNTTKPSPLQVRHLVFQLERALDLCPPGVSKIALIVDYHGATASSNPPVDIAKQVIQILGDHYCERLGRAIVMNVPWYLNAFFAITKPLLDQRTKDKIKFNPEMTDLMPRQQLGNEFGGEHNYQYDPKVYLPALCAFCGIKEDGTREDWIPKDHLDEKPEQIQRQLTLQAEEMERMASQVRQQSAAPHSQVEGTSNPVTLATSPSNGEVNAEGGQVVTDTDPVASPGADPAPAVAASAAAAATGGAVLASQTMEEKPMTNSSDTTNGTEIAPKQNGVHATSIGKKRGGPKLFGSKRGLDKQGNPTIHKHKHVSKIFCMHKGALDPSSSEAQTILHPAPTDTIPAETSKGKIRIASDAAESKPYNVPLATNATFGPDAYHTALEAPTQVTGATDYFAEARHKAIPVNNHEDRAETVTAGKALMQRLHTDNEEEDLTLAYKVLKPPNTAANPKEVTLSFDVLKAPGAYVDDRTSPQ